ncbi:MAG: hypothetical protein ABW051_01265 [Burkholderiaceae bacterium]
MQTVLIEGVEPRADDPAVLAVLAACARQDDGTGMRIGIGNEQGVPYRRVFTVGRAEFLATVDALREAGFVEELRGGGWLGAGFHAVFQKGGGARG